MNFDLKFDYLAALRQQNLAQSNIDLLRDAAKNCEFIPKTMTNKQLLLFLGKSNGDIDKAIHNMTRHYEIKRKAPQLFKNRDVLRAEIKQSLENQYYFNLPRTQDNSIVCYFALENPIAKNYDYNPSTTCFLMMMEAALSKYGPSKGLIMIYDMKNFRIGHMTRNNFKSMKSFFAYMQEGIPLNIDEIHIFNTLPTFNLVMKLISPLMKAEIMKKMHLHSSSIDLEKFHTEHVSKSCLPSDSEYGGVCESVKELHQQHCNELMEMREYFLAEEKQTFEN